MAPFRITKKAIEANRKLSRLVRDAETAGMVYCSRKSCGWGWDVSESSVCPQCGSLPEGKSLAEAKKLLKKTVGKSSLENMMNEA